MLKRSFDILASLSGLLVLLPLLLVLAVLIRFKLGSPILFKQPRPGLHGKPFNMLKFRSMTDERDSAGQLLDDELRLTAFGRLLRATSMDELPGLFNVLLGNMSLVGPRPLLIEYLPLYNAEQAQRHNVRPGITGWAQVNGRNALSWEDKFALDIWYVKHQSLWLDIKILLMTVAKVLKREDINQQGQATVSKFTGQP
ncbi:sugar transferase [Alteromonadaceae bacterium BrNp21-10]|nr:sugar transferase [Alteromonadaceae bacterium BrNp21-10]